MAILARNTGTSDSLEANSLAKGGGVVTNANFMKNTADLAEAEDFASKADVEDEVQWRDPNESYLVLSAHDFRSPRKANIHFISEELAKRGQTRFFSLRYSLLSRRTGDPRLSLDDRANKIENFKKVDCYLWKTPIHPFNTHKPGLQSLEALMYKCYTNLASPVLRDWIMDADVILFESGVAPVFFDLVKRLNPTARTIYIASDDLDTIDVSEFVKDTFTRIAPQMSTIRLPSKALAKSIPCRHNICLVPHGIDHSLRGKWQPAPFGSGIHAVSVGSMLFDPNFFITASRQFPDIHFHVIGSGQGRHPDYGDNVSVYGEMPHRETVRFLQHANFGIAPYRSEKVPAYLADTSMKLIQYDFLGLPAVCPLAVVGDYSSRFGYSPEDPHSIENAILHALDAPRQSSRQHFSWAEVTDRILNPDRYPEQRLSE